jgi:hypothetical protein
VNSVSGLPEDFETRARANFEKLREPEVTFEQYLGFMKEEFLRLQALERNPEFRYWRGAQAGSRDVSHVVSSPCGNGDFEGGLDLVQWQGADGAWSGTSAPDPANFTASIPQGTGAISLSGSHQTWVGAGQDPTLQAHGITLHTTGPDPIVGTPSAGAVRIGNAVSGAKSELLAKSFVVTPAERTIRFWWAVVLQDPGTSHTVNQKPFFLVQVTDASGVVLPGLVNLDGNGNGKVIANASNPFFQTVPGMSPGNQIVYHDWSCSQIDLSGQVGNVVTVEFITADCQLGAHYGYAYIDNFCGDCANSPTGSIGFDAANSSHCGPGHLAFTYSLPTLHSASGTTTGTVTITLALYQNGVLVTTLTSPVLSSGSGYSFPIAPTAITGINTSLGFDWVATAHFAIQGFSNLPPMTVGAAPDGQVSGQNNDYAITCANKWCCPGHSLLTNGDFEQGNAGFTSQYVFQPATTLGATTPGSYNIVTAAQALSISPQWVAHDHFACVGGSGTSKFMVVNGRTCQSGHATIWAETVSVSSNREYRFCANVKHLKQCSFDVLPKLDIRFASGTTVLQSNLTQTVVNTAAGACDWQLISGIVAIPAGVTSVTIEIVLDETGVGDGNDLALDDISFQLKAPTNPNYTLVNLSEVNIGSGQYTVTATPPALPSGYGSWWHVCEIDAAGNPVANTEVVNPSQWWGTNPNEFIGYNGTSTLTSNPNPGAFHLAKRYRITYGVWSDCTAWAQGSWILQENASLQKVDFHATEMPLVSLDGRETHATGSAPKAR